MRQPRNRCAGRSIEADRAAIDAATSEIDVEFVVTGDEINGNGKNMAAGGTSTRRTITAVGDELCVNSAVTNWRLGDCYTKCNTCLQHNSFFREQS